MSRPGQNGSPAHAAENMALEMEYSDRLNELRQEKNGKLRQLQQRTNEAKRRHNDECAEAKLEYQRARLDLMSARDRLNDQRVILRQHIHDDPAANNDFNQGELMRLTEDITQNRAAMVQEEEKLQSRLRKSQEIYNRERDEVGSMIASLHHEYRQKARQLREELMTAYKTNREKAEAERAAQEGGEV